MKFKVRISKKAVQSKVNLAELSAKVHDSADQALDHALDAIQGHKVLGYGLDRIVVDLNDGTVLKVQFRGTTATQREVKRWQYASSANRKWLCPILNHGENWVQMPKVRLLNPGDFKPATEDVWLAAVPKEAFKAYSEDAHSHNFGWYQGRIVWIDYAGW